MFACVSFFPPIFLWGWGWGLIYSTEPELCLKGAFSGHEVIRKMLLQNQEGLNRTAVFF